MHTIEAGVDQSTITRLKRIFEKQKQAFLQNPYPSAQERIELMNRVPAMLRKYREQILDALEADFGGHSRQQGDLLEIVGMFDRAKYNIENVKKWMKPVKKAVNPVTMGTSKAYVKYHPKGVVGNMVSWNFPFDIAIGPMLDQLAAGNRVIIKPSDLAPNCGKVLQNMIEETFEEEQVAVVNGGLDLAKFFPSLAWDHLIYTGSGRVGRLVMKAASENLVPVTLELGGKSPVIFHEDAVTEKNIQELAGAKAIKRGQMCVTADHCYVPKSKLDFFVKALEAHFKTHFADEQNGGAHSCSIITQRHLNRLYGMIEEAREAGVHIIQTAEKPSGESRAMPFYLVIDPPRNIELMQEEIFGPILPIVTYNDVHEVIQQINAGDKPLGLYIYSNDKNFTDRITENTQSGGVSVNTVALQAAQPSLPFGGIGGSGMGVHHGHEGFKEFSNPRGYFEKGGGGTLELITPPYDKRTDHLIEEVAYAPLGKQAVFALKRMPKLISAMLFGSK